MKASLVVNPVAGNKAFKYIDRIKTLLKEKVHLTSFVTREKGDAYSFARQVSSTDIIIIAGGDGTINEVINGVLYSDNPEQNNIPLALIPLGTVNVLAKELGIPEEVGRAVDLALTGAAHRISLGRINGRYFSLMAGIGFDGEAVLGVENNIIKKIPGKAAYIISGINALKKYSPPVIKIKTSTEVLTGYTVVIGNASRYGGNFYVTPDASITEPVLDVCVFRGKTRRDMLRFIKGIIMKEHLKFDDVSYTKAASIELVSDGKVHIQIDGDYFGTLPAKIDAVKDAVGLVCEWKNA